MNVSGLVRLTANAEMATTKNGKQVLKIKAVCNNGFGDNQTACWIDAQWYGDRGAKIAQYLTKGTQIVIHGDQVEANGYQGKDGIKASLRMNVINVELVANTNAQSQAAPKNDLPPATPGVPQGGYAFDDDIPFMRLDSTFAT